MLEQALQGAQLLYAYTIFIDAPISEVFRYTGEPEYYARNFDGEKLPDLTLVWEGPKYMPGSVMVLTPVRKDGTHAEVGAVRMELLHYSRNEELSFRFLTGNHLIYRFVYEETTPHRTEFTVNALIGNSSPRLNTMRQRLSAKSRRKAAIKDHLRVKARLEARYGRK